MAEEQEFNSLERRALNYFLSLKKNYADQRQSYEYNWDQALTAVYGVNNSISDKLDRLYNGLSNIQSPIMNWKVNGIVSRINKILFNVDPIGRIEDTLVAGPQNRNFVDLWNAYIFDFQLNQIGFTQAYKQFQKNKTIQGTAFAKITQEFEEKEIDFFDDIEEPEVVTVKDNTYFRNLLIKEFYSDVNKEDINESQACIHSTSVSMEYLLDNEKKTVVSIYEVVDEFGNVTEETEEEEVGKYSNLELLYGDGENVSPEQEEYIEWLGLTAGNTQTFKEALKETKNTGFVRIDECYGKFTLDGEKTEEVICTIANGTVVIQLEPTPFKHKRYVRPFIRGVYKTIPNCLYGESNVILGLNLLQELNASRAQAADAKTFSIFPMMYMDKSKFTLNRWDKQIRPMGIIEGTGPSGIEPIVQPYLGNIAINDSLLIQRDLDQLWSLSPVQEGTSDSRLIPNTAQATRQIISQNDMPLNDIINNSINNELKPFIEMLYERNLAFKKIEDLRKVWTDQQRLVCLRRLHD